MFCVYCIDFTHPRALHVLFLHRSVVSPTPLLIPFGSPSSHVGNFLFEAGLEIGFKIVELDEFEIHRP